MSVEAGGVSDRFVCGLKTSVRILMDFGEVVGVDKILVGVMETSVIKVLGCEFWVWCVLGGKNKVKVSREDGVLTWGYLGN